MKIMLISPHFAEYSLAYARALAESNEVLLVLNEVNARNELARVDSLSSNTTLRVVLLPHRVSVKVLVGNILEYLRLYLDFRPDVIHVQEEPKDYLVAFLFAIWGCPIVLTIHDPTPHLGHDARSQKFSRYRLYRWLMRRRARGIHLHSEKFVAPLMGSFSSRVRFAIAPHGPLGLFSEREVSSPPGLKRCLFFGRIQEYKGLGVFVQAIKMARETLPDIIGVIAGRGPDLQKWRSEIEGDKLFELKEGYLQPDEVISLFDDADVVVLPYLEASQSGVAAYAMGRGRALVVTNVGALPEAVLDGDSGLVVEARSPEALALALGNILSSPLAARKMGAAALRFGANEHGWRKMARSCGALYQALIDA